MSVKLDSTLQIQCVVGGFPKPEVNWKRWKDGKLLDTRNMLTINRVTYGDAGQYKCSAKNSEGKNEAIFHITVTGHSHRSDLLIFVLLLFLFSVILFKRSPYLNFVC